MLFGNDRVNVMAVDDGYVQVYGNERGPTWMNRFDEDQRNLGGGFSYVRSAEGVFCSAYRYAPQGADTLRRFGLGYVETSTSFGGVSVRHRVYPPFGDDPLVLDELRLQNRSGGPLDVAHFEIWDVNRHQLQTQWIRTGLAAGPGDELRDRFNGNFLQKVTEEGGGLYRILRASMRPKPGSTVPGREQIAAQDWYPPDVFLAALGAPMAEVSRTRRRSTGAAARPCRTRSGRCGPASCCKRPTPRASRPCWPCAQICISNPTRAGRFGSPTDTCRGTRTWSCWTDIAIPGRTCSWRRLRPGNHGWPGCPFQPIRTSSGRRYGGATSSRRPVCFWTITGDM